MKTLKVNLYVTILIVLCTIMLPLTVFADGVGNSSLVVEYGKSASEKMALEEFVTNANNKIKSVVDSTVNFILVEDVKSIDSSFLDIGKKITFDLSTYNKLKTQDLKVKCIRALFESLENSKVSTANKTKIYNYIEKQDSSVSALARELRTDMKTDYFTAYFLVIKPFSGIIGTFLGSFVLAIFIMLSFTLVMDVAYIVIPAFQLALADNNKENEKKAKIVSVEARDAVKNSYSSDNNKDALSLYFGAKVRQLFFLFICILYLASGQIYTLIGRIIDLFMGFLPQ